MPIPVVSFDTPREQLVSQIRIACLEHGFFQLTETQRLASHLFPYMRSFFSLPTTMKLSLLKTDHINGGYDRYQQYSLDAGAADKDLNEGFSIAQEFCETLWPEETKENGLIGFGAACREYYATMTRLSEEVADLIAEGLGLKRGYWKEYFERQHAHCRLIHYFRENSNNTAEQKIGAGLHSDWGLITLLVQDDIGGLQVQDKDTEEFTDVPPVPGAFVVNVGDLLSRFTNNVYVSAKHRVLAPPPGVHRYSIPFFSDGNPEYVVDVLPLGEEWKQWVQERSGSEPKLGKRLWKPVKAGEFFEEKWKESMRIGKN